MSERSVSCPGCSEKFGFETHIPLIFGSCGHSICSICVNAKKIGVCSDCQGTEGFLPNPKNELAIELLAILAQMDVQQPKLEPVEDSTLNLTKPTLEKHEEPAEEPRDALPAILELLKSKENCEILVKIVNQLEPRDFVRLSQTCKKMHEFCFNTKEIRMVHNRLCVRVSNHYNPTAFAMGYEDADRKRHYDKYRPQNYKGNDGGFLSTREKRKKLCKYPFIYELNYLYLNGPPLTTEALTAVRDFLSELPVKKIYDIRTSVYGTLGCNIDWNGLNQFVKDFHPRRVFIHVRDYVMPIDASTYFLQNKEIELSCDARVADCIILRSPLRVLYLRNSPILKETFEALALRFAHSTEEIRWNLGCQKFHFNPSTLFKNTLPFYHKGRVSEKRPLAFFNKNEPNDFYVSRKDGKVLHCHKFERPVCISFSLLNPSEYPPCLKNVASTAVSCPGCTVTFDFEANVRLIGSCVHSLCSSCASESETCPVCQEPGDFLKKEKRNTLANPAEKEAKKPKLEEPAEEPKDGEFRDENVVVPSCPETKSPPEETMNFFQRESIHCDQPIPEASTVTVLNREPILPEATLKKLASTVSCPGCTFSFDVETHVPFIGSCGHSLCSVCLNEMKLNENTMCRNPVCRNPEGFVWNKENELAIKLLTILAQRNAQKPTPEPVEEPKDSLPAILDPKNAEVLVKTVNQLEPGDVTDESILKSSLRNLHLPNSSISKETFEALVLRFAHSTEEIDWNLGCQTFHFNPSTLFKEILHFDHEGHVSEKRPLVFVKENEPCHFYILRKDRKVVHCIKRVEGPAQFSMLDPFEYPHCLQND